MSADAHARAAPRSSRRKPPRGGAPPPLPGRGRRPQPADRGRDAVPRAGRLHRADGADDERAGAVAAALAATRSSGATSREVFQQAPLWRWALNSFIYSSLATLGLLVSSIPVAYAFSRLRWRGRDAVFLVVLVALMLPPQVTVVPLYVMWAKLRPRRLALAADHPELVRRRVLDLPPAPVLPDDPRGVPRRRARRRLRRVPDPDHGRAAAREAGDRRRRALLGPLHLERLLPAAPLRRREPRQLGRVDRARRSSAALHQVQWNLTMAATLLVMAPVIVLFFLAQKAFVEGVTLTGVKG